MSIVAGSLSSYRGVARGFQGQGNDSETGTTGDGVGSVGCYELDPTGGAVNVIAGSNIPYQVVNGPDELALSIVGGLITVPQGTYRITLTGLSVTATVQTVYIDGAPGTQVLQIESPTDYASLSGSTIVEVTSSVRVVSGATRDYVQTRGGNVLLLEKLA